MTSVRFRNCWVTKTWRRRRSILTCWTVSAKASGVRRTHFETASIPFYTDPHKTERPSPAFDNLLITRDLTERSARFYTEENLGRPADPMSEYSIGIEDHYAWANLVSVTTSGPNEILLDKRRVELLDQQLTASPYHHDTLQMPLSGAEKLVRDVKTSANKRAKSALSSLIGELAPAKCRSIAIRVPPLPDLPATVAEVHANTWIMNRADGMIYHQALTQAAAQLNLRVFYFEKDNVLELAAQARGKTARDLERQLKAFGTTLGPPWRKGHVVACAGAIFAHVSAAPLRPKKPRQKGRA